MALAFFFPAGAFFFAAFRFFVTRFRFGREMGSAPPPSWSIARSSSDKAFFVSFFAMMAAVSHDLGHNQVSWNAPAPTSPS